MDSFAAVSCNQLVVNFFFLFCTNGAASFPAFVWLLSMSCQVEHTALWLSFMVLVNLMGAVHQSLVFMLRIGMWFVEPFLCPIACMCVLCGYVPIHLVQGIGRHAKLRFWRSVHNWVGSGACFLENFTDSEHVSGKILLLSSLRGSLGLWCPKPPLAIRETTHLVFILYSK